MDRVSLPSLRHALAPSPLKKDMVSHKAASEGKADSHLEKRAELQKGAKAFESYFIQSLLKEMRKGLSPEKGAGSGMGKSLYTSLFDQAISEKIAESGGIGLSKLLTEKLSQSLQFSDQATDKIKG